MRRCCKQTGIFCIECCLVASLVVTAVSVGVYHLYIVPEVLHKPSWYGLQPGMASPNFACAVMVATGRGFVVPAEGDSAAAQYPGAPELSRFLRQECTHLSPDQIPEDFPTCKPFIDWEYRHRYLLYTVGLLWRVFGLSWHVVTALRIALFAMLIGAVYGLIRLGMGRFWSTVVTLAMAFNLNLLMNCRNLRDFSKGPFILIAIFIMGYLIARPVKRRAFFALSVLLGLVIGFGVGFRADVLVCLVPAVVVLVLCRRGGLRVAVREKPVALVLLAVSFIAPASQVMGVYGGGSLLAHDILMGFATKNDDMLGLNRASYEKLYVNSDLFVTSMAIGYNERSLSPDVASETLYDERRFLVQLARTFPGDLITRGYASVWYVAKGGTSSLPWGLFMAFCAAVVLLIIAHQDLRLGWMTLFLFFYFGGYLSLQAESRHAFHLLFIPYWILGFLLNRLFSRPMNDQIVVLAREHAVCRTFNPCQWNIVSGKVLFKFFLPVVILLTVPLYAARAVQSSRLESMAEAYATAELVPVPAKARPVKDWTLFERTAYPPEHGGSARPFDGEVEYWVAEFAPGTQWRRIWLQYIGDYGLAESFTHGLWIAPGGEEDSGNMRYFFPVVEFNDLSKSSWALFAGIAMPNEYADDFRGLYKVRDKKAFPLFLNLAFPADRNSLRSCQKLYGDTSTVLNAEEARFWLRDLPEYLLPPINGSPGMVTLGTESYRECLVKDPDNSLLRLSYAASLESQADKETVLNAYREAIDAEPSFFVTYGYMEAFLKRNAESEDRIAFWKEMAALYPEQYLPLFHLGVALEENQDQAGANAAYAILLAFPFLDVEILEGLEAFFKSSGDLEMAREAGQRVHHPEFP